MTYTSQFPPTRRSSQSPQQPSHETAQQRQSNILAPTLSWTALAFVLMAAGGFLIGPLVPESMFTPLSTAVVIFMLASVFLRKIPGFAYVLFFIVPTVLGVILYPVINQLIAEGNASVITLAATGTGIIFGTTAIVAWITPKTIYRIAGILFGITVAMVVIGLLNSLFFHLSMLSLVISFAAVIVFTLWSFIDIQRLRDGRGKPVEIALSIFLDIFNIFVSLLNIIRSFTD